MRTYDYTINDKTLGAMNHVELEVLSHENELSRLRDRLTQQLERCRELLARAERDLGQPEYQFGHSLGILGGSAHELDLLAAEYCREQQTAARLRRAAEFDHREANPGPARGVVVFLEWVGQGADAHLAAPAAVLDGEGLEEIARQFLSIPTLKERRADSLDFHEVSVWSVRDALQAAFEAGKRSEK